MTESIFRNYSDTDKAALQSLIDYTNGEIQKKEDKELKLKQLVEEAEEIQQTEQEAPKEELNNTYVMEMAKLSDEVCEFFGEFQETDADLKKACGKQSLAQGGSKQSFEKI